MPNVLYCCRCRQLWHSVRWNPKSPPALVAGPRNHTDAFASSSSQQISSKVPGRRDYQGSLAHSCARTVMNSFPFPSSSLHDTARAVPDLPAAFLRFLIDNMTMHASARCSRGAARQWSRSLYPPMRPSRLRTDVLHPDGHIA